MTGKLLPAVVASVLLIAGAIIGLRFAREPLNGGATGQAIASSQAEEDRQQRKTEQQEAIHSQEERKLAEARRVAKQDSQRREAEQLGMILALRHEEEGKLAEGQHQAEQERQRQAAEPEPVVLEQRAEQEQKLAEAPRQVEQQQVAQAGEPKLADARGERAHHGTRLKKARLAKCTAPCRTGVSQRRAGTAVRRAAYRSRARYVGTGYFACPFLGRLHVALAELTTPHVAVNRQAARAHYRHAVVVR